MCLSTSIQSIVEHLFVNYYAVVTRNKVSLSVWPQVGIQDVLCETASI